MLYNSSLLFGVQKYLLQMVPELVGLGYHEQYSSPPSSSTKWPIFFYLFIIIKLSMSTGRWIKKIWYSSSPSSSTRKSGRFLYCSETVFLGKIFSKLMIMGHFALNEVIKFWNKEAQKRKHK